MNSQLKLFLFAAPIALLSSSCDADICGDIEKIYDQAHEAKLSDWLGSKRANRDGYNSKFRLEGASACYLKLPYDDYLGEYSCDWQMGSSSETEGAFKQTSKAVLNCPFLSGGILNEDPRPEKKDKYVTHNGTIFSFHTNDYSKQLTIFLNRREFRAPEGEAKYTLQVTIEVAKGLK